MFTYRIIIIRPTSAALDSITRFLEASPLCASTYRLSSSLSPLIPAEGLFLLALEEDWTPTLTSMTLQSVASAFPSGEMARRFPVVSEDAPSDDVLALCKGLSAQFSCNVAVYGALERGDHLYHDWAWIFAPVLEVEVAEDATMTFEEEEEFVVYVGEERHRGWLLWGQTRMESRHHDSSALYRVGARLGVELVSLLGRELYGVHHPSWEAHRHFGSSSARFERLRALLYHEPVWDWMSVIYLIEAWEPAAEREMAIAYVSGHLAQRPDLDWKQYETWLADIDTDNYKSAPITRSRP